MEQSIPESPFQNNIIMPSSTPSTPFVPSFPQIDQKLLERKILLQCQEFMTRKFDSMTNRQKRPPSLLSEKGLIATKIKSLVSKELSSYLKEYEKK